MKFPDVSDSSQLTEVKDAIVEDWDKNLNIRQRKFVFSLSLENSAEREFPSHMTEYCVFAHLSFPATVGCGTHVTEALGK
ncbi:MAG: hypothetical protein IPJ26_19720 [Bacteroidetes bacterium]|nr:hypothetical protein [Bacteroidota bacterium]